MANIEQSWQRTKGGIWFALLALSATSWAALPAALIAAAIGGFLWVGDVRPPRP